MLNPNITWFAREGDERGIIVNQHRDGGVWIGWDRFHDPNELHAEFISADDVARRGIEISVSLDDFLSLLTGKTSGGAAS